MPLRTSGQRKVASYLTAGAQLLGNVTQTAGQILLRDGAVGDLPIAFALDTNTGAWRAGADDLRFAVGGTEQVRFQTAQTQFLNHVVVSGNLRALLALIAAEVTPTVLAANTNNWAPGNGAIVRLGVSANVNVTGMVAGSAGEIKIITLVPGAAFSATLTNEDALSTAGNRWTTDTGANLQLGGGIGTPQIALAVYDGTTSRWRVSIT
jgi:hypothetical protein